MNLSIYEESIFDAIAQQNSGPGPLRCPPEQAGMFAVSLAVCFSDAGHYDKLLCENLVQQVSHPPPPPKESLHWLFEG